MLSAILDHWRGRLAAFPWLQPKDSAHLAALLPVGWGVENLVRVKVTEGAGPRQDLRAVEIRPKKEGRYYGVRIALPKTVPAGRTAHLAAMLGRSEPAAVQGYLVLRAFAQGAFVRQEQRPIAITQQIREFGLALSAEGQTITVQTALVFDREVHGAEGVTFLIGDISLRVGPR